MKRIAWILFFSMLIVASCDTGGNKPNDNDTLLNDVDYAIPSSLSAGEQQYATALADTGRAVDFTVTDPAGNGEEIATDMTTGLIWTQTVTKTYYAWQLADYYCKNLVYAGLSGWRLPTPHELASTVDYGRPGKYVAVLRPESETDLWTSLRNNYSEDFAWYTKGVGDITSDPIDTSVLQVMCVLRDKVPAFNEVRYEEKTGPDDKVTVVDHLTDLEWTQEAVTIETFQEAKDYCDNLLYGDKDDWRLPEINELRSLIDYTKCLPASNFPGVATEDPEDALVFWTARSFQYNDKIINWYVFLSTGHVYNLLDVDAGIYVRYVRCVR